MKLILLFDRWIRTLTVQKFNEFVLLSLILLDNKPFLYLQALILSSSSPSKNPRMQRKFSIIVLVASENCLSEVCKRC